MIRALALLLAAFMLSGCMLDRLWARDKEPSQHERLVRLGLMDPGDTPAADQYQYHFNFWKIWMADLVDNLEGSGYIGRRKTNYKRLFKAASESHKQLAELQALLLSDKQQELEPHIERLAEAVEILGAHPRPSQLHKLSRDLQREKRAVDKNFRYSNVREFINPSAVLREGLYEETSGE